MLLGMKESYKKGKSESILAPSLAGVVVRRQSKRRQGYRWARVIELRKTLNGALNPIYEGEATRPVAPHRERLVGPACRQPLILSKGPRGVNARDLNARQKAR
jgi:hypothetical protein